MHTTQTTYLPVNWADGMKINKDHFRSDQQASSWQQSMHSSALLNEHNYGLFPTGLQPYGKNIILTTDNQQQVTIRLLACHAITPGGYLIHIQESTPTAADALMHTLPNLQVPYAQLTSADTEYYVMLAVNPFNRVPVGQPDMEESQIRQPYTAPSYSLHLVDIRDNSTGGSPLSFHLPLGRIRISEGKLLTDEEYIPPCTSAAAHPALAEFHTDLEHFFGSMETYVLRIQQKIIQKHQQNDLSSIIGELCHAMNVYLCGEYQRVLLEYKHQPPIRMMAGIAGLARLMKNKVDIHTGPARDELLGYFSEWCGITQTEWESALTSLSNFRYDHRNIRTAVQTVEQFTTLTLRLFHTLASLEYIGRKREAGIFVKEHLVVPAEELPAPRRKSFLAD
jgi:predicted component of type VI protein secretion system